ncbi:MAG TPA: hypothetical protein VFW98_15975 [Gemmatimonadaceae bacterium]|nr:hypothetical protein [Gemmatimonadaceae bacterium]
MISARRTGFTILAVVVAFVAGFLWQFLRAQSLTHALEDARAQMAAAQAEATLGAAALQADQGGYDAARGLASEFFTTLQNTAWQAPATRQPAIARILGQRDSVITLLSRSDPGGAVMLRHLFVEYRTGRTGRATPKAPAARPTSRTSTDSTAP